MKEIYDVEVTTIEGKQIKLALYQGKIILIVNVASQCGFTSQYDGLEELYRKYGDQGLVILGFPCNQFGAQEPGSEEEIMNFCRLNYGVTFPMFAKIDVNGPNVDPLYILLKKERPGFLGSGTIKWNFTKFLVDRDGNIVERYSPSTKPTEIEDKIISLL
ncbi:glutathione peroxidase [uncultured Desulfobulbus sp.]|uniref:glutathione peroxidase n=1 Tax=uncultured Desulfobulbus sp. TaxID=239745 RepID=UPI0029C71B46|nr:glutathione peroxidase [uncultured Desulfobulbus sp.]